eukprot:4644214-Lingulodinium_polyedra.AAC.1
MLRLRTWKAEGGCSVHGLGGMLYRVVWRMRRGLEAGNWLQRTSRNKRWLRASGEEWRLVSTNGDLNGASH